MRPIDLIATDMDGTLLNSDQQISAENIAALGEAAAQGITLVISSGRMPQDISAYMQPLGIPCWVSGCNGALVWDAPFGRQVERHLFPPQTALDVCHVLLGHDLCLHGFATDTLLVVDPEEAVSDWHQQWAQEMTQKRGIKMRLGKAALLEGAREGLNKLVAFQEADSPRLQAAIDQLALIPGADLTSSWRNNVEIMPAGVGKGQAIARIAQRLGIPAARVMAIGDQENDRSMLSYAGHSVAMGNAPEAIKAISRHLTAHHNDHGVALAIRKIALGV